MRILVLQTTRMGDTLQTSPMIRGLRQKHPGAHIAVMVRPMAKTIAARNPDINEVIVYEEDGMFLDLRAQDSDRLLRAYNKAEEYIQRLKDGRFDVAYNCTHSIASASLLKLAGMPKVVGAHLSDDGQFVLRGPWVKYFFTSVFHRDYNDLNLCDISHRFVPDAPAAPGLVFEVQEEDRRFVAGLLAEHHVGPDDFVACFQLGASEEAKRWPEAHFAGLGRLLAEKRNARIFLVGVKDEAPLGQAFEGHAPGLAVPLYGKTSLPELAALLERAHVLVTNDTGTMHIAAAMHCPVVLVSVGYVHFRETGPYGAGHCAIERRRARLGRIDIVTDGPEERLKIAPEHVLRAVDLTLEANVQRPVVQMADTAALAGGDLYMTRFAPDGCLQWYPVVRRPITKADFIRVAYRAMWLEHLQTKPDTQAERESLELMAGYYEPPQDESIEAWHGTLTTEFDQLAELAKRGTRDTEKLLKQLDNKEAMRKAQHTVRQLMDLDEQMRLFSELHPAGKPLIMISRFERDNLEGADPIVLARTTLQIYRDCFARARLMRRKLDLVADAFCAGT